MILVFTSSILMDGLCMSLSASLIYHSASQKGRVWRGPVESNHRALVGSWDDQSGEGLLMHTVALIAWTVLICFWGEGGSRYSGKTPKASKNGLQLCPKTIKFQAQGRQSWSPEGSWAGLGTSCAILGQLGRFWQLFGASWKRRWRVLGRLGPKKVANMVPSWAPKR